MSQFYAPDSYRKGLGIFTHILIPTGSSQLEWVGGEAYLFLKEQQSLCVLNGQAALAWQKFQSGVICLDYTPCDPSICSRSIVDDLRSVGAIEALSSAEGVATVSETLVVETGIVRVLIGFDDKVPETVKCAFDHMCVPVGSACGAYVLTQRVGEMKAIALRDEPLVKVNDDMLVPQLKLAITEAVLEAADNLLLHAAVAVHETGQAILLVGGPGAGKSTLATALEVADFALAGDDIAVLNNDGSVFAIPFPSTLKKGSWRLLDTRLEEINGADTHLRPDGQHVRYLPVDTELALTPRQVGWIVFLDRQDDEAPTLIPQPVPDTLSGLISQAWSGTRDLTIEEFGALAACVNNAQCFRLRYSDLKTAVAALSEFCNESAREI